MREQQASFLRSLDPRQERYIGRLASYEDVHGIYTEFTASGFVLCCVNEHGVYYAVVPRVQVDVGKPRVRSLDELVRHEIAAERIKNVSPSLIRIVQDPELLKHMLLQTLGTQHWREFRMLLKHEQSRTLRRYIRDLIMHNAFNQDLVKEERARYLRALHEYLAAERGEAFAIRVLRRLAREIEMDLDPSSKPDAKAKEERSYIRSRARSLFRTVKRLVSDQYELMRIAERTRDIRLGTTIVQDLDEKWILRYLKECATSSEVRRSAMLRLREVSNVA